MLSEDEGHEGEVAVGSGSEGEVQSEEEEGHEEMEEGQHEEEEDEGEAVEEEEEEEGARIEEEIQSPDEAQPEHEGEQEECE